MLEIIVITLLLSTILNVLFKKLHLPTIIGYIITGTVISYWFGLHKTVENDELKEIAEFGIVFLMFTIGLEFSIEHLKRMKKEVFIYGTLQVVLSTILFTFISLYLFGLDTISSIIIGCALSLSSTAIVLKLFNESNESSTSHGKNTVGVLLFQDIAVIPILLMITLFASKESSASSLILQTIISALALFITMWVIGRKLLDPFFSKVLDTQSQEIFIGSILLIVLSSSYISHYLGFSYSLGAFIAGMMIAETHYKHQVEADLVPFRELLLGIFFITVGMQLQFDLIIKNIWIILFILPLVMLVKFVVISSILIKHKPTISLKSSLALFGLGEFALVILELAKTNHLISQNSSQILISTVILSLILTPFIIKNLSTIVNFISKKFTTQQETSEYELNTLENHILLIGYGRLGKQIAKMLKEHQISYAIIEGNDQQVRDGKSKHEPIILGNALQINILEAANIKQAKTVFISIGNNRKLLNICSVIHQLNPDVKIIVKANTFEEKNTLTNTLNESILVIVETEETAQAMFKISKLNEMEN